MQLKLFLLSLLIFLGITPIVLGQEITIPQVDIKTQIIQAENEYRNQFDLYRSAYSEFTRTKAVWNSAKTLKAEQEALIAGKAAAVARDNVMIAYTHWLRLQLYQFSSTYDKSTAVADQLLTQVQWFEQHRAKINAVTTILAFDEIMAEYSDPLTVNSRDNLYSIAQLELKLANLAFFQHQARALYDPILKILETKTSIPEVAQGFTRINQLSDTINAELVAISNIGGGIKAESFNQRQFHRLTNDRLSVLQSNQINLLEYIIELESRYAK